MHTSSHATTRSAMHKGVADAQVTWGGFFAKCEADCVGEYGGGLLPRIAAAKTAFAAFET